MPNSKLGPGTEAPTSIAVRVIKAHKLHHHNKGPAQGEEATGTMEIKLKIILFQPSVVILKCSTIIFTMKGWLIYLESVNGQPLALSKKWKKMLKYNN